MRKKWQLAKTIYGREYDPITREPDPDRDEAHLAWIRSLPCALLRLPLPGLTPCRFVVEVHHPTGAGLALKAPDRRAIPLCAEHHRAGGLHEFKGRFLGWSVGQIQEWERVMSDLYECLGRLRKELR